VIGLPKWHSAKCQKVRPEQGRISMSPDLQLIMKRKSVSFALASLTLMSSLVYGAQSSRPDLSGIWLLDREKSDLKSPPISTDPSHKSGTGGGHGGARTGGGGGMGNGGSGMGGGNMGSGRGGGHGVGGTAPRVAGAPLKLDLDFYQIGEVADQLTIEHTDSAITIKPKEKGEDQQPLAPLSYTTDGKTHETSMANGGSIKSKTSWEGQQLVTKCKEKSALGSIEIDEARTLSDDGKTLIINLAYKGSSSHWTEKAVYRKGKQEDLGGSPRISHTHF
jgi:hypothetical protein